MDAQSRKLVLYNKELETIKNNQIEKKNTTNEKYTRWHQQQSIDLYRGMEQRTGRLGSENH